MAANTPTADRFEQVRVTDKRTDAEVSVARFVADADPERYTIHDDKRAVDGEGRPLPPKPHTTVDQAAAKTATKTSPKAGKATDAPASA